MEWAYRRGGRAPKDPTTGGVGCYNTLEDEHMAYMRFMICLAIGLTGVCMVLKTLLDTLFADWDVISDFQMVAHKPSFHHHSAKLLEDEIVDKDAPKLATRMDPRKRETADRETVLSA